MRIRLLLVEHQTVTRVGMRTILGSAEDLEIAGEAAGSAPGIEMFRRLRPDVTILALRGPDSCAVDDLDRYFEEDTDAKIIILADRAGDAEISRSLKKGALGYVCKESSEEEILRAVRTVSKGKKFIPEPVAVLLSENLGREDLTKAENRVLRMIVGGMSNKEIGFALDITENTVKTHVSNVFQKLGVSDRTSAATTAIRRGLVRIDI